VIIGANGVTPGAIVAAIIAATLIVGVFAYAMNTPSFHTGGAPGASTSAPGTTGQGGRAPPSGTRDSVLLSSMRPFARTQ
jgi:hypothetical protein